MNQFPQQNQSQDIFQQQQQQQPPSIDAGYMQNGQVNINDAISSNFPTDQSTMLMVSVMYNIYMANVSCLLDNQTTLCRHSMHSHFPILSQRVLSMDKMMLCVMVHNM